VTQSGDHLLDLGKIVGRGGFPDPECEDAADDHPVLSSSNRKHLGPLFSF
jgi:hypothetical protein